ncbi:hypothetical protein CYMTET_39909 [Cymbomonas tetramitiformis]|uniref:Geranylgeranyl transferase type-2 subunit alpha n=1 Tax=Cymbomonas tetramitiformis TaxID=36881 RepID=A0AAE0C950_9CHLO|nr:hypothetical protein CYMTET_39909 [Cymbomonas tetramitiformis]
MHGRKRETRDETTARKEASRHKVDALSSLLHKVIEGHAKKQYDDAYLKHNARLLELNPEVYTAWNARRAAFLTLFPDRDEAERKRLLEGDFLVTEKALQKNPKSYSSWHHRKWLVAQGAGSLTRELELTSQFLDMDERNFHCWSYRRFIVNRLGRALAEELKYTLHKIEQNFSNYSAWHFRSSLLSIQHHAELASGESTSGSVPASSQTLSTLLKVPKMYTYRLCPALMGTEMGSIPPDVLDEEFQLVQQAFFTEPADQSGWLYHRWLIGHARSGVDKEASSATVSREIEMLQELIDLEPDTKWGLHTLCKLMEAQQHVAYNSCNNTKMDALYEQLITLDPMRQQYYKDSISRLAISAAS